MDLCGSVLLLMFGCNVIMYVAKFYKKKSPGKMFSGGQVQELCYVCWLGFEAGSGSRCARMHPGRKGELESFSAGSEPYDDALQDDKDVEKSAADDRLEVGVDACRPDEFVDGEEGEGADW